ncbi:hypothetical protein Emtol_2081 [Emticicia oligotrophica DSM 17448]|uniref:Lipoprotein n=1 Tax=Emticicia oligotrophica (strain DSM 17448 / CIP 109782 / MTCC 6937 / GPTSA100-15) TaxID=929562 RepID=A0ABM5N1A6_EMTOG|nr:hypothetical protein [Emticicia oligotrophica]AFK03220.1 hypothetical protein Emtol_2081 [Emticicia oligotrophica DSM 17448]
MRKLIVLLVCLSFFSCKKKEANFGKFDLQSFKTDRGGCEGKREKLVEDLKTQKNNILGLTENQVVDNLGRYDFQILSRRNEKVFVYYLEKGPQCEMIQNPTQARSMILYFNAASLVKEVSFQYGSPVE